MISHLNIKNKPQIVNVSKKKITERIAKAEALVCFKESIFKKIKTMRNKKGNIDLFSQSRKLVKIKKSKL